MVDKERLVTVAPEDDVTPLVAGVTVPLVSLVDTFEEAKESE
jgi:hypothetical protein